MGVLTFRNQQAREEVAGRIRALYEKVDVYPGSCRFNFRCHDNAVHEAIENEQDRIAQVVYIQNDYPVVHYVNVEKDGQLVDNTLGHNIMDKDFYLVKMVYEEEFSNIHILHEEMRNELRRSLSPLNRIFSDYTG